MATAFNALSHEIMGKVSPKNTVIGCVVPREIRDVATARAHALGMKMSRFASLVLQQWAAEGYPSLDKVLRADATMRAEVMRGFQNRS